MGVRWLGCRAVRSAVHALASAAEFGELDEIERVYRLYGFSDASPARRMGRFTSLNLMHLCDYGTLEFRRFDSTFDGTRVASWAHFCVSFVECFSVHSERATAAFLAEPVERGLAALREAQESATSEELLALMADYCDPCLANYLQLHLE